VSDIRSIDPDRTPLTVRHAPSTGQTNCHAASVSQAAASGSGSALNVDSHNTDAPLIRGKGAGPLVRLYDSSGTLRFEVANDGSISTQTVGTLTVTGNATIGGTLGVTGAATFTGAVIVDDANFSVLGTGKGYRFRPLGSRLDCEATGSDWMFSVFSGTNFDGSQRTYLRLESGVQLAHACGTWIFTDTADSAAVHTLDGTGNKLGFHGATSVAKQTVTGSRGGNAALADLLSKLATLGLITDGSSA